MDYGMDSGLDYVADSRLEIVRLSVVIGSWVAAARPLCGGIPWLVLPLLEPYRYPAIRELPDINDQRHQLSSV